MRNYSNIATVLVNQARLASTSIRNKPPYWQPAIHFIYHIHSWTQCGHCHHVYVSEGTDNLLAYQLATFANLMAKYKTSSKVLR